MTHCRDNNVGSAQEAGPGGRPQSAKKAIAAHDKAAAGAAPVVVVPKEVSEVDVELGSKRTSCS